MKQRAFDLLGNVAIVNFPEDYSRVKKKKFAEKILKENNSVKTVLEKSENFSGRLRTMKTNYLAGEKNKEVLYKENGCVFRFNIDDTYFSPRLSGERNEVASMIKKGEVLVMFAGVGPYSIVIAKNPNVKVYSNEMNKKANKYERLNLELNKLKGRVELFPGDIKKVTRKLKAKKKKFDWIVMPRPNLKDSFLKEAFMLSKKGTKIIYYDFCPVEEIKNVVQKIKDESKRAKKKIKILRKKKAGEIAPYKIRLRVDFVVA